MHVDNIRAQGDMNGAGDVPFSGHTEQTRIGMQTAFLKQEFAQSRAQAGLVLSSLFRCSGEELSGFASHAKATVGQASFDIFAGSACQGQLDVMNGRGSIEADSGQDASPDPVNQIGSTAGLDDMSAQCGDHGPIRLDGCTDRIAPAP
jgi:hypothetical protein